MMTFSEVSQFLFPLILLFCTSHGLKIKVILPTSLESPAYFGHLTTSEKMEKFVNLAQSRVSRRNNNSNPFTSKILRLSVVGHGVFDLLYFAKIGVGWFDSNPVSKPYYFAIDTDSSLTWLQCEACKEPGKHCFPQINPPFPNNQSYTDVPLKHSHDICVPASAKNNSSSDDDELCTYNISYGDGSFRTAGEAAYETFTFESDTDVPVTVRNMIFGCGFNQTFPGFTEPTLMAGILGLDKGKTSLQMQLDPASGVGLSFSYCFPSLTDQDQQQQDNTYLLFGDDVPQTSDGFQSTQLLPVHDESYSINMIDIIVNRDRLHIPPATFGSQGEDDSAVVIDSGSTITFLVTPAYAALKKYLISLFSTNDNYWPRVKAENETMSSLLCYDMIRAEGYLNLPTIVFLFQDSYFEIRPKQGFMVGENTGSRSELFPEYFCLMMQPDDYSTIIGAYQQVDHRFIYDLKQSKLWFKNDNCAS